MLNLQRKNCLISGESRYQIALLTYLINSLFKNKKIDLSLSYAEQLQIATQEYNGFLRDKMFLLMPFFGN